VARRFRKIGSLFACLAVLFWGLAGIAPAKHGAAANAAVQDVDDRPAQGHVPVDGPAGGTDHCGLSGCSFAAMAPVPFGAFVHAHAPGPFIPVDADLPRSGGAPPLRPPRLS